MLVLGDDILLGRIGIDLVDRSRLPTLFQRGLLIGIADGDVTCTTTAADRCLDRLLSLFLAGVVPDSLDIVAVRVTYEGCIVTG